MLTRNYQDDTAEQEIFSPLTTKHDHEVEYLQLQLWPAGLAAPKPWSTIPEDIRQRINGIMLLKLRMTEEDIELFPNLKVYVSGPILSVSSIKAS